MRGRQKGQTKRMSIIKDPVIAPYEIQVEEEAAHQHQIALATTECGAGEDEWLILNQMNLLKTSLIR